MAKFTSTAIYERTAIDDPRQSKCLRWLADAVQTPTDECREWPFDKGRKGYGRLKRQNTVIRPHRMVCYWAHGKPESEDMHAAHSCNNRACVNPRHLRWASLEDNERDKSGFRALQGSDHWSAKLDAAAVKKARGLLAEGLSRVDVADQLGVSMDAIKDIDTGRTWAWLE
jgi:hypothetical protein